ncbi:hypothetical protein GDO78_009243 [Eleutherodactylus coqui]|uniref:Uncharacterized protein n=1 Tax=Eleutherodactylus coqui TaxID=57060 RepID=A0A8J6K803_ELECQ|nr:hypothetical protein GDO78_009243 [Eleutherodactylus coqui]
MRSAMLVLHAVLAIYCHREMSLNLFLSCGIKKKKNQNFVFIVNPAKFTPPPHPQKLISLYLMHPYALHTSISIHPNIILYV